MNQIVKDRYPDSGRRLGLRERPYRIRAKGNDSEKPDCCCNDCGGELKRIVPATERLASVVGYAALLVASSTSLWQMATVSQVIDKDWLVVLYGVSVIGIGLSIVLGLARRYF